MTPVAPLGSDLLQWFSTPHLLSTFLVFCRISGLFWAAPFFNHPVMPAQLKLWFALSLAVIFYLTLPAAALGHGQGLPQDLPHLLPYIVKELGLGFVMGLVMKMIMDALHLAGEQLSTQMGLSIANALDPITGQQNPVLGNVLGQYALVLFMALGIHHWVLLSVHHSFELIPIHVLPHAKGIGLITQRLLLVSASMFSTGLMLAAPLQALLLLVDVSLGYISKLMPQMNVFMVASPLKLMLGFWGLITFLPSMQQFMTHHYEDAVKIINTMFANVAGS
jgi:flagellar biosynthesis protein FliR